MTGMKYAVKVTGMDKALRKYEKTLGPGPIRKALQVGINSAGYLARTKIMAEASRTVPGGFGTTGQMRNMVTVKIGSFRATVTPGIPAGKALALEYGRKGRRSGRRFPVRGIKGAEFRRWVVKRFGKGADPWTVMLGISKKGTKPKRYFGNAIKKNHGAIRDQVYAKALELIKRSA